MIKITTTKKGIVIILNPENSKCEEYRTKHMSK